MQFYQAASGRDDIILDVEQAKRVYSIRILCTSRTECYLCTTKGLRAPQEMWLTRTRSECSEYPLLAIVPDSFARDGKGRDEVVRS